MDPRVTDWGFDNTLPLLQTAYAHTSSKMARTESRLTYHSYSNKENMISPYHQHKLSHSRPGPNDASPLLQERRVSQGLLGLDCSSDLKSYTRNLGPNIRGHQVNPPTLSAPAPPQQHQDPILPGFVQKFGHPTASEPNFIVTPRQPQQLQTQLHEAGFLIQPEIMPRESTPPKVDRRNPSTYPLVVRNALEASAALPPPNPDSSVIYTVVEELASHYMEDSTDIIGTFKSLHSANLAAAKHFFQNLDGTEEQEFRVTEDGRLEIECESEGSTGGHHEIHIRKGKINL